MKAVKVLFLISSFTLGGRECNIQLMVTNIKFFFINVKFDKLIIFLKKISFQIDQAFQNKSVTLI